MDHGGEAARPPPTTVETTDLAAWPARSREARPTSEAARSMTSWARPPRPPAASVTLTPAGRIVIPPGSLDTSAPSLDAEKCLSAVAAGFHFHRQPGQGVAYPNIGEFWRQPGPLDAVLIGPQLPDGIVPVHDSYVYSALQLGPGAGRGVVLVDLDPGGGVDAVYDNYGYYALLPDGHGDVLVDLLPDGAGHGEVLVALLPDGVDAVHDDYGYYPWRRGAGRGEAFIGPLPDGVGVVFDIGNFAQQTLPGTGRADGITGALRSRNLGAGYDGSVALPLVDDLGAVYDNRGMVTEHLRRLLPLVGIGASSVAVNGHAAGPGSPAVAFPLFVLLLGGLILVMLHVLRV